MNNELFPLIYLPQICLYIKSYIYLWAWSKKETFVCLLKEIFLTYELLNNKKAPALNERTTVLTPMIDSLAKNQL